MPCMPRRAGREATHGPLANKEVGSSGCGGVIYDDDALDLRSSTLEVTDDLTSSTLSLTCSTAALSFSCSSIFAVMP